MPGQAAASVNGAFDSGALTPWITNGWVLSSAVAQSGSYSASVTGNVEISESFSPVPDTTIASLSFWIEHTSTGVQTNAYNLYYSDGSTVQNYVSTFNTVFDQFDVTNRLNPAKSLVKIGVWGTTFGITYLDTVALTLVSTTPLPEAPSAVLLALPFLALGALRRRT